MGSNEIRREIEHSMGEFQQLFGEQLRVMNEKHEQNMEEVRQMFVTMKGTCKAPHREEMALADSGGSQYRANTRYSRIDFPKFSGEDLRGWVYRCEQFFEYEDTTEESKVKVVAIYLEGRALQ